MGESLSLLETDKTISEENKRRKSVGEKIKFLRRLKGDTLEDVCKEVRLGGKSLSEDVYNLERIESGEMDLKRSNAEDLADYFDIKLSSLYFNSLKSEVRDWSVFNNNARKLYVERSKAKGVTLKELASDLDMTLSTTSALFSSSEVYTRIDSEDIQNILDYYGVSINYLNTEREVNYFDMRVYTDGEGNIKLIRKYHEDESRIEDWELFNKNARKLFLAQDKTLEELTEDLDLPYSLTITLFSNKSQLEKLPPEIVDQICSYFGVDISFFTTDHLSEVSFETASGNEEKGLTPDTSKNTEFELDKVSMALGISKEEQLSVLFQQIEENKRKNEEYKEEIRKQAKALENAEKKVEQLQYRLDVLREGNSTSKGFFAKVKEFIFG